jgi:hypothetical protein
MRFENAEALDEFYPGYLNIEAAMDENARMDLTKVGLDSSAVRELLQDVVERERPGYLSGRAGCGHSRRALQIRSYGCSVRRP